MAQNRDLGFYSIHALPGSSLLLCKVFLGYIFVYIKLNPVQCIFHISLLFSVVFFMDTNGYKAFIEYRKTPEKVLYDYDGFWDLLFSFVWSSLSKVAHNFS